MSLLLAKPWNPEKHDPTDWWMSEKLDGVRAIWTGTSFLSRNLKPFYAPKWFTKLMPDDFQLDGELFVGRGSFQDTVSVVRSQKEDKGWDRVRYHVFDFYNSKRVFEQRQQHLRRLVWSVDSKHFVRVIQTRCLGYAHLSEFADGIFEKGGEGVMLRQPGSLYEKKRSSTLLKVKRFFDLEARVLSYVPGKGKHLGRMGAIDCVAIVNKKKTKFQVGTGFTDEERETPPKIGSKITIRFQELTRDGVPRFPVYVTERNYE